METKRAVGENQRIQDDGGNSQKEISNKLGLASPIPHHWDQVNTKHAQKSPVLTELRCLTITPSHIPLYIMVYKAEGWSQHRTHL